MSTGKTPPKHPFPDHITKEEINKLPLKRYTGKIIVVKTESEFTSAVKELKSAKVLGFDTETRPAFKKGQNYQPSLLQLANGEVVYLFQLNVLKFSKPLRNILANKDILKVGVGLDYDIRKLRELSEFEPAGFVELSNATTKLGIQNNGLRGLTALLLGFRISKAAQCSNWSSKKLTQAQIDYAATDAWVSLEMYRKLKEMNLI